MDRPSVDELPERRVHHLVLLDASLPFEGLGDDLQIDVKTGTCGKDGQFKPVGVGQPTVLFSEMTVGGTRA